MSQKRVKSVDLKSSGWRHVTYDDGSKEVQPPTGATMAGAGEPAPAPRGKKTEKERAPSKTPKGLSKVEASLAEKPKTARPVVTATLEATADADRPRGVANPPSKRKARKPRTSGGPASGRPAREPKRRRSENEKYVVDKAATDYDKSILDARTASEDVTSAGGRLSSATKSGDSTDVSNALQGLAAAKEASRRATGARDSRATGSQPTATVPKKSPSLEFSGKNVVTGKVMTGESNPQAREDDNEFKSTQVKNLTMHLNAFREHAEAHRGGDAKARGKMNAARYAYHNAAMEHGQMPGHPDRPSPETDAPCYTPDCPNTAPITSDGVCSSCDAKGL